jgi:hypothetical protein
MARRWDGTGIGSRGRVMPWAQRSADDHDEQHDRRDGRAERLEADGPMEVDPLM